MTLPQKTILEIEDFLAQVPAMTAESFQVVDRWAVGHHSTRKSARSLLALGAADFSWLRKQAQHATGPLHTSQWLDKGIASGVLFNVEYAAQAIVKRDKLTPDQYEAFVGGFRQVGAVMPPHPLAQDIMSVTEAH